VFTITGMSVQDGPEYAVDWKSRAHRRKRM
jgi:hypothetical protein